MRFELPEYNKVVTFPDDMPKEEAMKVIARDYPEKHWYSDGIDQFRSPKNFFKSEVNTGTAVAYGAIGMTNRILGSLGKMNKMMDDLGSRHAKEMVTQGFEPDKDMMAALEARKYSRDVIQPKIDAMVEYWRNNETNLRRIAKKNGINAVEEVIGETIGGAIPGGVEFALGVPWAVGAGMAEAHDKDEDNLLWEGIKEGMHRYVLGKIFTGTKYTPGISHIPKWAAIPTTGTVFAADSYFWGGSSAAEALKSFGSGALIGAATPTRYQKKNAPQKQFHEMTVKEFSKETMVTDDGRILYKKTGEEFPLTQAQKVNQKYQSKEEWIEEAHENVLRKAHDEGKVIPDEAIADNKILQDLWKEERRMAAEGPRDPSTSERVGLEEDVAKERNVPEVKDERVVRMSEEEVLDACDEITKSLTEEHRPNDITGINAPYEHVSTNFKNISTGDVARIVDTLAQQEKVKDAVGGTIHLTETKDAAVDYIKKEIVRNQGYDLKDAYAMQEQSRELTYKAQGWKMMLVSAGKQLVTLREKARATNLEADLYNYLGQLNYFNEVLAVMKNTQANMSRSLSANRISIDGKDISFDGISWEKMNNNPEYTIQINKLRERVPVEEIQRILKHDKLKPEDIIGRAKFIHEVKGSAFWNAMVEYSNINLLATPTTQSWNLFGNIPKLFVEVGQTYGQAAFSRFQKGSKDALNRVTIGEANTKATKMLTTAVDCFIKRPIVGVAHGAMKLKKGEVFKVNEADGTVRGKTFTEVLRDIIDAPEKLEHYIETTGVDPYYGKAQEVGAGNKILSAAYMKKTVMGKIFDGILKDSSLGEVMWKTLDVFGAAGRDVSYGLLSVVDKPFKEIHYNGELAAQIYKASLHKEFPTLAERKAWIDKTTQQVEAHRDNKAWTCTDQELKMVDEIHKRALNAAREGTWQAELGTTGKHIEGILLNSPMTRYLGVRFFKTPVNLLKEVGHNTPVLGLLAKDKMADLAGRNGVQAQSKAFAQQLTGGLLFLGSAALVKMDIVTGSHPPDQRDALLAAGIPEYSIRNPVNGKYYQYNRADPYLIPLALMADAVNVSRYMDAGRSDELFSMVILSLSHSLFNKTWATQLGNIFNWISDPKKYGNRLLNDMITPVLPGSGLARFATAQSDPLVREAETVLAKVQRVYPMTSKSLNPDLDYLGREITHDRPIGAVVKDPNQKSDVYKWFAQLGMRVEDIGDKITQAKGEVRLTPDEHWKLQKSVDEDLKLHDFLNEFVKEDSFLSMPDDIKEANLKKIVNSFHKAARKKFLGGNEKVTDDLLKDVRFRVNSMKEAPSNEEPELSDFIAPNKRKHLAR